LRKPVSPAPVLNAPAWVTISLLALSAVLLAGWFSTEIADPDFWWHLKTGEYIVTQHRLPVPDPFAYTTAGAKDAYSWEAETRRFNLTHEWLAQAVLYVVERAGGFPAVVLWKAVLLALLCACTGGVARMRTGSWLWGVAAAMAAASLAVEFAKDRPSILSFVFTAVFIAIYESRRLVWMIPLLALVWANCHGGFFLGWVVCGAYSAEALLRRSPGARRILTVSGLAVLLSGLNPNAFAAIGAVFRYRRSVMQSSLIEWSRADLWGPPVAFDILLYGSVLVLLLSWKGVRPADWLLFAAFAAASLIAFRNEMLIGLFAPILIATYFPWQRRLPVLAHYVALALLAAGIIWGVERGGFFQLRAAEWRYPAGAAAFLTDHHIPAPLFNTYEYGGYFIWKGQRVFIDGRALSESVFDDYRKILGSPPGDPTRDDTMARYGIGAIAVNAFEYNSGVLYPLVLALAQPAESHWKLVFADPQSLVFLREVPAGVPVLDKGLIVDHLEAECQWHVERDPEFSLCARKLGDFFMRAGDNARARRWLAYYLDHPYGGEDPEARRAYMQLLRN
jgi:hypothetical protein